ncbi:MAG: hypothetical protein LBS76_02480 [Mycoplasmataceae bacterium]|jgi:hypothetical protein|nr:hypothetical protein [Mycoplasmataceae bacterium]
MNFVAQIGITETVQLNHSPEFALVTFKVEKPYLETSEEEWYDLIPVLVDKTIFNTEIKQLTQGAIIGVKGRLSFDKKEKSSLQVICERLQVF